MREVNGTGTEDAKSREGVYYVVHFAKKMQWKWCDFSIRFDCLLLLHSLICACTIKCEKCVGFLFNHNKLVPEKAFALIYYFNPIQIDARQIDFAKKE